MRTIKALLPILTLVFVGSCSTFDPTKNALLASYGVNQNLEWVDSNLSSASGANESVSSFDFAIRVCLSNQVENHSLQNKVVDWSFTSQSKALTSPVRTTTDMKGCLLVNATLQPTYENPYQIVYLTLIPLNENGEAEASLVLKIGINPLLKQHEQIWDYRNGEPILSGEEKLPRIVLSNLNYRFRGNSIAELSDIRSGAARGSLGLTLTKHYEISLNPEVITGKWMTQTSSKGGEIPQGDYALRLLIVFPSEVRESVPVKRLTQALSKIKRTDLSGNQCTKVKNLGLVCPTEKQIKSNGGQLTTDFEIRYPFNEMAALEQRAILVLELSLPAIRGIKSFVGTTDFIAFQNGDEAGVSLRASEQYEAPLQGLLTQAVSFGRERIVSNNPVVNAEAAKVAPPSWAEIFRQTMGVTKVDEISLVGMLSTQFQSIQELESMPMHWKPWIETKRIRKVFCGQVFGTEVGRFFDTEYEDCVEDIKSHLRIITTTHLVKLNQVFTPHKELNPTLTISAGFFKEFARNIGKAHLSRNYYGAKGESGFKLSIPLIGESLGWDTSATAYTGHEESFADEVETRLSMRDRIQLGEAENLKVQKFSVGFSAQVERCVWVEPVSGFVSGVRKSLHFCSPRVEHAKLQEVWTYVSWNFGMGKNLGVDPHGPSSNSWSFAFFGDAQYEEFKRTLSENTVIYLEPTGINDLTLDDASEWGNVENRRTSLSKFHRIEMVPLVGKAVGNVMPGALNERGTGYDAFTKGI